MDALLRFLERVYTGFFLRDILGFVAPGSISLVSLWFICNASSRVGTNPVACDVLVRWFKRLDDGWKVVAFLVASYLLAWTLQVIHYGVVDLLARIDGLAGAFGSVFSEYAPGVLILNGRQNRPSVGRIGNIPRAYGDSSAMTRVSLELDLVLPDRAKSNLLGGHPDGLPYAERASALAIMSSNLAIAMLLVMVAVLKTYALRGSWRVAAVIAGGLVFLVFVLVLIWWRRKAGDEAAPGSTQSPADDTRSNGSPSKNGSVGLRVILTIVFVVPYGVALCQCGWDSLAPLVVAGSLLASALLYLEYWRLIRARNLQLAIYADALARNMPQGQQQTPPAP